MKKINLIAMTMAAAFSIQTVIVSAASLEIKSDNTNVAYTYSLDTETEVIFDVQKLFSGLSEVSVEDGTEYAFAVTNNTDNGDEVEISLCLEFESATDGLTYSPLDYYSFVIKDEAGDVVYDSSTADLSLVSDTRKEIALGVFNEDGTEDTKAYIVECKLSEEGVKNLSPEIVSDLEILLAVSKVESTVAETPVETTKAPKPKFELETVTETATVKPTENITVDAPVSESVATDAPVQETKEKKFVCGVDITSGRYVVKGNGNVKVESSDGVLESEIVLNDGSVEGIDGELSGVITLSEGDVVTLTPLAGQETASVSVEKTNTGSSGTDIVRASNAPLEADKTNPKTGEDGMAIFVLIMALSVVGITTIEIIKRKKAK